jgi:hypothetical protein
MSYSISLLGTPENICKALDEQSLTLTGQSKAEFDEALPHLKGLVSQNSGTNKDVAYSLNASGHGYVSTSQPEQSYNHCQCDLKQVGKLC